MRLILPHLWMWTHYTLLRNVVRPLSRVGTNIRPPGGGSNRGVAALRLTFPPAYGPRLGRSSTGGAAPPRPPRAAPPVRPSAHGPLLPANQWGKSGARWVVPTERSDWGQHSSGKDCPRNPPPPWIFEKRLFGKRSASGRRRNPCGQGGAVVGACGQAGRFASLSTCAHVGPACPAGRTSTFVVRPGSRFSGCLRELKRKRRFSRGTPESCISGGAEISAHFVYLMGNKLHKMGNVLYNSSNYKR